MKIDFYDRQPLWKRIALQLCAPHCSLFFGAGGESLELWFMEFRGTRYLYQSFWYDKNGYVSMEPHEERTER